ncbi:protease inhibitor EpiC2B [Phytophthora cinnamomi]|uniref:protease inhibitor EpiC2B n=1 Tax=Phytophthora cinnamomi TaxID=4785 RepID=UPI00355A64EA|nr:protease inhibitor EpiC2B [Phytophthora cinnamomi]
MPSISAIAVTLFGLAPLAISAAEDSNGGWSTVAITGDDSHLLYAAWGNVSNYGAAINEFGCGKNITALQKKPVAAEGSKAGSSFDFKLQSATDYHFTVDGCSFDADMPTEYYGFCSSAINCLPATFEIYISSEPKANTLKVTAVTAQIYTDAPLVMTIDD